MFYDFRDVEKQNLDGYSGLISDRDTDYAGEIKALNTPGNRMKWITR